MSKNYSVMIISIAGLLTAPLMAYADIAVSAQEDTANPLQTQPVPKPYRFSTDRISPRVTVQNKCHFIKHQSNKKSLETSGNLAKKK